MLLLANHGALTVGADLITAYYRMETLELYAKISLTAHLLGGEKEISQENINRLIAMRPKFGVTGRHPGFKRLGGKNSEALLKAISLLYYRQSGLQQAFRPGPGRQVSRILRVRPPAFHFRQ